MFGLRCLLSATLALNSVLTTNASPLNVKSLGKDFGDLFRHKSKERRGPEPVELHPVDDIRAITHGQPIRRQDLGNAVFNPLDVETFSWATLAGQRLIVVNLTLSRPNDNEFLLPLKNFATRLKFHDCGKGDNKRIAFGFHDPDSYKYARSKWEPANNSPGKLTIVTEPDQCYQGDARATYIVNSVKFDDGALTSEFAVEEKPWTHLAQRSEYRIKFGTEDVDLERITDAHARLKREENKMDFDKSFNSNLFDFPEDSRITQGMAIKADVDFYARGALISDMEVKSKGGISIFGKPKAKRFGFGDIFDKIESVAAPVIEEVKSEVAPIVEEVKSVAAPIVSAVPEVIEEVKDLVEPETVEVSVRPEGMEAFFKLSIKAKGKLGNGLDFVMNPEIEIGFTPFRIKNLLELGPFLVIGVHVGADELKGDCGFTVGAKGHIDNKAKLYMNMLDTSKNENSGWDPNFEKVEPDFNGTITGTLKAWMEWSLVMKAEVFGKWGYEAAIDTRIPYLTSDLKTLTDDDGVCNTTKTLALQVTNKVGMNININAGKVNQMNPDHKKDVYQSMFPLFTSCVPFGPDKATKTESSGEASATGSGEASATGSGEASATGSGEASATGSGSAEASATGSETGESSAKETGESSATETGEASATETGEASATETGEASATETGESSAAETGETSAAETGEASATETGEASATETGKASATETGETSATETGETSATETGETSATEESESTSTSKGKSKSSATETDESEATATESSATKNNKAKTITDASAEATETGEAESSATDEDESSSTSKGKSSKTTSSEAEPTETE
ncbi:hypothetical protein BU24DRAFT_497701 [Aaosphaeria arxii CBS 175.79]|uniref:Uncharacterized protein n=1 Tax=Aaosphaeria arxii CBS 175.79 TaxID=1450172 RepID=A0A6A5X7K4_9PLEO|nr:uncharacterized protein BU24DRAFT_497701 [Aaosphaeria arxii CBS 175.79]KAF2008797.1 hypothetical protein BU24DRAFT_497701 [Aaosphaeria arxii CBS 175.79]